MLMRPRKFFYKNVQKKRSYIPCLSNKKRLIFGNIGLIILQSIRLTSKIIFRYKLILKKSSRKVDKTSRYFWFNIFPHLPFTKKIVGSRMGKGKGKAEGWVANIKSGSNIFEFKNLRNGRAIYFCKQIGHKLPSDYRIIKKNKHNIKLNLNRDKTINYDTYW